MVLEFLQQWWGLIAVALFVIASAIFNWQHFKKKLIELIFIAEETARERALKTGKEKFEWVASNGYKYVPYWAKIFVTEEVFRALIQKVFDNIFAWAKKQELV
jgi:hypothetical protein